LGVCGFQGNAVRHQSACLRIKIAGVIPKNPTQTSNTQYLQGVQAKLSESIRFPTMC